MDIGRIGPAIKVIGTKAGLAKVAKESAKAVGMKTMPSVAAGEIVQQPIPGYYIISMSTLEIVWCICSEVGQQQTSVFGKPGGPAPAVTKPVKGEPLDDHALAFGCSAIVPHSDAGLHDEVQKLMSMLQKQSQT